MNKYEEAIQENKTFNRLIEGHADLSYANLHGADLSDANLYRADLRHANLSYANLHGADLSAANLSFANLLGANLHAANLRGANLHAANLSDANLHGADLSHAKLSDAKLSAADLSGADLRAADLSHADLSDANLKYADLKYADLSDANLLDANLLDANLHGANLSAAKGLLSSIKYIHDNFEVEADGSIIAYKTFSQYQSAPDAWVIESGSIIEEVCNPCRVTDCGSGINIANLAWEGFDDDKPLWKVRIRANWLVGVVVPYHTDGKIRCEKCQLIEIVS